jgi:superfamily II DNA or RNA helicase
MSRSITAAVAHEFTGNARLRGEHYELAGRVELTSASAEAVEAVVDGTEPYRVTIARTPDHPDEEFAFDVSCGCPYYLQECRPCKHLWATFVAAEREGHLTAGAPLPAQAYLHLLDIVDDPEDSAPRIINDLSARPRPTLPPHPGVAALARIESELRERDAAPPAAFRYAGRELLYVFALPPAGQPAARLLLKLMVRGRKTNGEWTKPKPAPISEDDVTLAPDPDRRLLAALSGAARATYGYYAPPLLEATYSIPDVLAPDLVPAIAQTGRAFVEEATEAPAAPKTVHGYSWTPPPRPVVIVRPIRWDDGPPWRFEPAMTRTESGWTMDGRLVREDGDWLGLADLLGVDRWFAWTRTSVARADAGSCAPLLAEIIRQRTLEIPGAEAPRLSLVLAQLGVPAERLPEDLRVQRVDTAPIPRLRLTPLDAWNPTLRADLSFVYGDVVVPASAAATFFDGTSRRLIARRPDEERAAIERLLASGVRNGWDAYDRRPRWELPARLLAPTSAALLSEGWQVEAQGRPIRAPGAVRMSIASDIDWFDLHATVEFGDTTAPLADVLAALGRREAFVRLGDGSSGLLPEDWLRRYLPLAAAGEPQEDGRLRFRQPQAALLDALLESAAEHAAIDVDAGFQRAREALAALGHIAPVDPPAAFTGTLRDYQREGLGWLQFLARAGFGGCLADDMGLGKTVMVLALLLARRDDPDRGGRPSLVVVPRSLVHNWMNEAARFAPSLRVIDYSTSGRLKHAPGAERAQDVLIATYGTLRRDVLRLKDVELDYVILDESQAIKNANTASAKAARLLRARHRLALTGTPIENHLGELWSLFEFLNPGVLGTSKLFQKAASGVEASEETLALLARGLRPFILRRTKQQVARELPARTEQTLLCELSKPERAFYEQLRQRYRASVLARVRRNGVAGARMHILEALLRLRQAACHIDLVRGASPPRTPRRAHSRGPLDPRSVRAAHSLSLVRSETTAASAAQAPGTSAKLDVLLSHVEEILDEGHKALVFSQFTTLLGLVRQQLDARGIRYAYLDGRTRDRAARIAQFQTDPGCRLFLISLKAGGTGLNLTAAEYVFLLDPWWNPAVEAQAIDRTHRIGQTREVFAYRLVAEDTIESKILELQARKRALADAILQPGGGGLKGLQQEDLELLLG